MLCGLQGAGKTTMAAKLAAYLKKQGKKPLLVACDIYRPAAIKQLQVVGEQVDVPVFEHGHAATRYRSRRKPLNTRATIGCDLVIIDTAGRLHIDERADGGDCARYGQRVTADRKSCWWWTP